MHRRRATLLVRCFDALFSRIDIMSQRMTAVRHAKCNVFTQSKEQFADMLVHIEEKQS